MRKYFSTLGIAAIAALVSLPLAFAQSTSVFAVDSAGTVMSTFSISDDVFVEGECLPWEDTMVDIYIVNDNSSWVYGNGLTDVRGAPTALVTNASAEIMRTMLWTSPLTPGDYDVVVDADRSGNYSINDCIDDLSPIGFTVPVPSAGGSVSLGSDDPGNHEWIMAVGDPNNVMMQFDLQLDGTEDVEWNSVELEAKGTGDDSVSVDDVMIVEDVDQDGEYDVGTDTVLGLGTYVQDNDTIAISTVKMQGKSTTMKILVVYEMNHIVNDGETFSFDLVDVTGLGKSTSEVTTPAGLPLSSGVKTVRAPQSAPVCTANLNLELNPSTAAPQETVTATAGGFSNCLGETVEVHAASCDEDVVCSCSLNNSSCSCEFNAISQPGAYEFVICRDGNSDEDFDDVGEMSVDTLAIVEEETEEEEKVEEEEVEEEEEAAQDEEIAPPFEDVEGHWAEDYIEDLRQRKIIAGREEGKFDPDALITRAEVLKIAYLAFRSNEPLSDDLTQGPFPDVLPHEWHHVYVMWGDGANVVEGYPDGTFKPNQVINRVEALKILLEAAGVELGSAPEASFPDTDADAWYAKFINYAIEKGVISGFEAGELAGMFGPEKFATRAEIAKMVSVLLAILGDQ